MAEVGPNDASFQAAVQRERKISGATARIQAQSGRRSANQFSNFIDGDSAPIAVDGSGKEMIEEVVPVGNTGEHLPDGAAIRTLVLSFHHSGFP